LSDLTRGCDPMPGEFPISNAGIASAFDAITQETQEKGFPEGTAHRLAVILDELCSNMIRHDDTLSEQDSFALAVDRDGDRVLLTISDPGQPFDPFQHSHTEVPEIGGHGISLVKGLSCGVEYTRNDGRNRVRVWVDPAD